MPSRPRTFRPPWMPRYGSEHERKAALDRQRPSSTERGYDKDWFRFRAKFLKAYPRCSEPGCTEPATQVDHIKSVREHPELRLVHTNCRSFCHPHHSARTARDQGFGRRDPGGSNL